MPLPRLLVLLLLLTTAVLGNQYDYGPRSTHYTAAATQAMIVKAAQCLPQPVTSQIEHWLQNMRVMEQQRMLHTIALERILREMEAGQSLCQAIPVALRRVYSKHELSQKQLLAMGVHMEWGDGWQETALRMREVMRSAGRQCQEAERRAALYDDIKWPDRRQLVDCLRAGNKESKKATLVHHLP